MAYSEYPKWVRTSEGEKLANSAEEEAALQAKDAEPSVEPEPLPAEPEKELEESDSEEEKPKRGRPKKKG